MVVEIGGLREVFEGFLTILVGFSWVSGNDLCLVCRGFSHGFRWFQVGFWVGFRWGFFLKEGFFLHSLGFSLGLEGFCVVLFGFRWVLGWFFVGNFYRFTHQILDIFSNIWSIPFTFPTFLNQFSQFSPKFWLFPPIFGRFFSFPRHF